MAQAGVQTSKSKEIKNTLDGLIENYRENPENIAELLAFKSRFYHYSMNNAALIRSQNPHATYVASYEDWKEKGYQVQRGQRGIKIIFPIRTEIFEVGEKDGKKQYRRVTNASPEEKAMIEKGQIKSFTTTRFGVGNVFDISQTDCPPEDYPNFYHMGYSSDRHAQLYDIVKQHAIQKGISVEEADLQSIALRGQFFPMENSIRISDKLNDTEKLSTLTHELGHALLHGDAASRNKNSSLKELEADCVSIMLQEELGIELTEGRKKHFVQHYNVCKDLEGFQLEDVLKNVNLAYFNLRNELDPIIENAVTEAEKEEPTNRVQKTEDYQVADQIAEPEQAQTEKTHPQTPEPEVVPISKLRHQKQPQRDYKEQDAAVLDYIKRGVSILQVAEDMGFTPQQIGGYYTLKEHDSVRIYPDTNSFHRFSTDVGGSTIDFAMHFGGMNEKEAIRSLKEKYVGDRFDSLPQYTPPEAKQTPEPKKFELPQKTEGKFSRAFAYLTKTRCLDSEIVQSCMKDGLIYEDNKHNVVFVGKDAEGTTAYATRHTTLTDSDFKRDVAGSRQDIGFMVDHKASRLYVTEAPIDALSIMCLRKQQGHDIKDANYMATCGTGKDAALYYRLRTNPHIKEVVLANDNDEAGQAASRKIFQTLKKEFPEIKISCLKINGKDPNEHLCQKNCPKNPKKKIAQEVER